MLAGMYRRGNPSTLSKYKFGAATEENSMEGPQKIKTAVLCSSPALLLKRANTLIGKDMHPDVQ